MWKKSGWILVFLLAGCSRDSGNAPATDVYRVHKPLAAKKGPSPAELTAGMVEAVTTGKSIVPVTLKFEVAQRPVVGQSLEVMVAVMPQIVADSAVLTVAVSPGLQFAAAAPIEIPAVEPTQVYRHNLALTPGAEGLQLLDVSIALKHDEITETRVFEIPLIVSAAGPTAAGVETPARGGT